LSAEERTYLELVRGGRRFAQVLRGRRQGQGADHPLRADRRPGPDSTKTYPTADAARAEAQKKIGEKTKKGYAPAVMGERKKRAVNAPRR